MARGKASGYVLTAQDASFVLAMQARGDRDHDIAAWFGVNQGRVAEVKDGKFGNVALAAATTLPPTGAPGVKGKRLREAADRVLAMLKSGDTVTATTEIEAAIAHYNANEA